MNQRLRKRFDALLEGQLADLPEKLRLLLEEVPLIVDDEPSPDVLSRTFITDPDCLCGLYTGIPLTRRSVRLSGVLPDKVQLFRRGIFNAAADADGRIRTDSLRRQIRITLLHEIGHHFGFSESRLRKLGYA